MYDTWPHHRPLHVNEKLFDATSELWSTLVIFLQQRIEYRNYSIVYLKRWDVVKYCQIARPILLSSDFLKKEDYLSCDTTNRITILNPTKSNDFEVLYITPFWLLVIILLVWDIIYSLNIFVLFLLVSMAVMMNGFLRYHKRLKDFLILRRLTVAKKRI